jgi:ATP-dependent helicase/nuclease subunit B
VTQPPSRIHQIQVADAGALLAAAADALAMAARESLPDLAHALVLLPNLHAADEFKRCLLQSSAQPALILPRVTTYAQLADDAAETALQNAARSVWLCGALRARNWFDDASRWGVCREMGGLFDQLTAHNLALPQDLAQFREQLRAAYGSGVLRGIDFEARLVSELWFALEGSGAASPAAGHKLKLAEIAHRAGGPLVAVLFEPPEPEQTAFFSAWAQQQSVTLVEFSPESAASDTVTGFLHAAWPAAANQTGAEPVAAPPLLERAAALRNGNAVSPLAGKLTLVGAASGEQEAKAAALSIRGWLGEGAQSVGVVAQDRLVARRLRALLEREHILVSDEAGWKLSTTSAATVVSRWLDTLAEGFYYRDVLDLLKSPFALTDIEVGARREQVHRLEQIIRRKDVVEGLEAIAFAVEGSEDDALRALVERLCQAQRTQLPRREDRAGVPLGAWLNRLQDALKILGVKQGLEQDLAGRQLLDLLRAQSEALAGDRQLFAFHEWRGWLNGEFEAATFLDTDIQSPVVFTQLAATRLRRFDKVLVIGADAMHLPGEPAASRFFNQRVRANLGLPTAEAAAESLRREFIALIALAGETRVSWQAQRDGEPNAPAPLIDALQAVHSHAFNDGLAAPELASWLREDAITAENTGEIAGDFPHRPPRPCAPALVPQRISVSGYASLVACPYQFYSRHMLRLNEADEVEEQVAKRDFGDAVHRILKAFHQQVPQTSALPAADCLQILDQLGEREFAPLLSRNPLAAGFHAEWKAMMGSYVLWQQAREAEGWRFHAAEVRREHTLPLSDGGSLVLNGRLDRIDVDTAGNFAVLDYKTRSASDLKKDAASPGEDVQLASYALLLDVGGGAPVQAGYIALERRHVTAVPFPGDPAEIAAQTAVRLDRMFTALRAGAQLPAQGVATVCTFCEMRGLCRREYWEREGGERA